VVAYRQRQLNKFSGAIGALQPWSVFRNRVS
jgi:hypothetical protein